MTDARTICDALDGRWHGLAFPGVHVRYVLHSNVRIEWISEPEPVA